MITKDSLNEQVGLQTMCRIVEEIVEKVADIKAPVIMAGAFAL